MTVGADARLDRMSRVGVDHTDGGVRIENISDNRIREGSIAAFSEATWHATERLRLVGALRADHYRFDVERNPGAGPDTVEGSDDSTQISPKAALAYSLNSAVELYAKLMPDSGMVLTAPCATISGKAAAIRVFVANCVMNTPTPTAEHTKHAISASATNPAEYV